MRKHLETLRPWIAVVLIVSVALGTTPSAVAQQTGLPVLDVDEKDIPPACHPDMPNTKCPRLKPGEAAKAAERALELGMSPETGQVVDLYITAMTMAFPAAGGALLAAKEVMGMLGFFDDADPVQEALKLVNQRLEAIEKNIRNLQSQIDGLGNTIFYERNYQQTQRLLERHARVEPLVRELQRLRASNAPANDPRVLGIADEAGVLAGRFLFESDKGIWDWSDLRVYTHPETRELLGNYRPPEFKPLPTFEFYAATLALWVSAIHYEANGDAALVRRKYGGDLMQHVAFLSARDEWGAMAGLYGSDAEVSKWIRRAHEISESSLQENIASRVQCVTKVASMWPEDGVCGAQVVCGDRFIRSVVKVRDVEFRMDDSSPNAMCMAGGNEADVDQEEWERRYGTDSMTLLARKLTQLATLGSAADQLAGRFAGARPVIQFLYGVNPTGAVFSFEYTGVIDPTVPPDPYETRVRDHVTQARSTSPSTTVSSGAVQMRRGGSAVVAAPPPNDAVTTMPVDPALAAKQYGPPITNHHLRLLGRVASNWPQYSALFAAGSGGIVGKNGTCLYALTPAGELDWYRHEGFLGGKPEWSGPVRVGEGWNRFTKIFAGGEGVLYGIQPDGALLWYKHAEAADGRTPPNWAGPQVVGSGWQQFVHVFSTGDGLVYGVEADGRLFWYRHKGYRTGSPEWEGPKEVGSGWAQFTRLFSPGNGVIYGLRPSGELLWYHHQGNQDGSVAWQGPVTLATNWNEFTAVVGRMDSPLNSDDVR